MSRIADGPRDIGRSQPTTPDHPCPFPITDIRAIVLRDLAAASTAAFGKAAAPGREPCAFGSSVGAGCGVFRAGSAAGLAYSIENRAAAAASSDPGNLCDITKNINAIRDRRVGGGGLTYRDFTDPSFTKL